MVEELVMERFWVTERLGSGGMGTVYKAFDERLQRHVALKEVAAADPDRVLREAQAAARLNHPAIVTLYELGEHRGRAILVSELVPGETLAALEVSGELCDRDVAEIVADLCDALIHAHGRGVVHRDIKPHNVIVRDDPATGRRAKLMDFGIARLAGAPTLTTAGEVVGTLAYMSPEQAEGEHAGPESDVYSLALTAYECWAGQNPVAGRSPAETARRIGAGVTPLRAHRPDLPEGLADTIDACLEHEPESRPTPAELRDCLEAESARLDSVEPLPAIDPDQPLEHQRRSLSGPRLAVLAGLAIALVALAGPLDAGGAALVLAVLSVPSLLAGASLPSLAPLAAPLLGALGIGGGSAALGAGGSSVFSRAVLGAGAWIWLFTASVTLGLGPDAAIAPAAADGWASSPTLAVDTVLGPLAALDSILGALIFALGSVALGWLLRARHASLALLGAMIWAAAVDACLTLVGDGSLGGRPIGVVVAAAVAVAIEFGARSRARSHGSRLRRAPRPAFAP